MLLPSPPKRTAGCHVSAKRGGVFFRTPPAPSSTPPAPAPAPALLAVPPLLATDENKAGLVNTTTTPNQRNQAVAFLLKRAQSVLELCQREDDKHVNQQQPFPSPLSPSTPTPTTTPPPPPTATTATYTTPPTTTTVPPAPCHTHNNNTHTLANQVRSYVNALVSAEHNVRDKRSNDTDDTRPTLIHKSAAAALQTTLNKYDYMLPSQAVYGLQKCSTNQSAAAVNASSSSSSSSSRHRRPLRKKEMKARMKHVFDALRPVIEKQKVQRNKETQEIQRLTGVTWGNDVKYRDSVTNKQLAPKEYMRRYFQLYLVSRKKESERRFVLWQQRNETEKEAETGTETEVGVVAATTGETTVNSKSAATFQSDLEVAQLKCWHSIEMAMRSLEKDTVILKQKWANRLGGTAQATAVVRNEVVEPEPESSEVVVPGTKEVVATKEVDQSTNNGTPVEMVQTVQTETRATEEEDNTAQIERRRRRRERRRRRRSIVTEIPSDIFAEGDEEEEQSYF
jgi:hypothetical protein